MKGAVAAGHRLTAESAAEILRAGGNAFDAAIAGFFTACVTESVLASLGGGGFLLARDGTGQNRVFDFFTHTPKLKPLDREVDFYPVTVDFGTVQQEFHIGSGACAVPGVVRGMFSVHAQLGKMPIRDLVQPAVDLARSGVTINPFQSYLLDLVAPIYLTDSAFPLFASPGQSDKLLQPGDVFRNEHLADVLEMLSIEGEALFYEGEIAALIVQQCRQGGGYLGHEDLQEYDVCLRTPLEVGYRDHCLVTNPAPSAGGLLISFGLELLKHADFAGNGFGSESHLRTLIETLLLTSGARSQHFCDGPCETLLHPELLAVYRQQVLDRTRAYRGTTHISVLDAARNIASLTVSNGEGCGQLIPGTGFMLNNMLGEEDVNPGGFHQWQADQRMSSMMAPSILLAENRTVSAFGSGGSNRIRTAILQVVCNIVEFGLDLEQAITNPRVHIETDTLSMESDFPERTVQSIIPDFPDHRIFDHRNMFFGGVHAVRLNHRGEMFALGDPRRDGVGIIID